MSGEKVSYVGRRFGRLTVVERVDDAVNRNGKRVVRYKCLCDCGNEKIVRKLHLTSGKIISCGCYHREQLGNIRRKHGMSHKDRIYGLWLNMKDRCYNKNNNHYNSYGGRGITICDEWKGNFQAFYDWCMSHGYKEEIRESGRNNLTIDRKDVNGNYEPSNCRFITNKENCLNKRDTMSDDERYKVCPICGKKFIVKQRNHQQTCSVKCGQVIRAKKISMERNKDGTFKKAKV